MAAAIAVQLLLAVSVVSDRRAREPDEPMRATPRRSATPSPSPRVPVFGEEAALRRRIALNTAHFAARQECPDSSAFQFEIIESTVDLVESVVYARGGDDGVVVKVTLLQGGGVSYNVLSETGDCDA